MEPRSYSPSPIGTNFLILGYSRTTGGVSIDLSLPITDVQALISAGDLGYEHTFALGGRMASVSFIVPYVHGDLSGLVGTQSEEVSRSGLADLSARFAWNFIGNPALTPKQFARRKPTTTVGASVVIVAPTGSYDPSHLINIGSNRLAFRPEVGAEQPMGKWFVDGSAGLWLFTDNTDYLNGKTQAETPLSGYQVHGGYNFRPGMWLAADATYYSGGRVSVNGVATHDVLANSRYGLTLATPLANGFSTKLAWSRWLNGQVGTKFNTIGLTLQYRWFDR